jgi:hypothetical protein
VEIEEGCGRGDIMRIDVGKGGVMGFEAESGCDRNLVEVIEGFLGEQLLCELRG